MCVELKYAGIPFLGMVAVHYWFVTADAHKRDRWEVWQRMNAGGLSAGYLHRNLMHPDSNVGGGPTHLAHVWTDALAQQIALALHESWEQYPYLYRYQVMPGPNSNTFVAWILHRAGVEYRLSRRAVGKNFVLRK